MNALKSLSKNQRLTEWMKKHDAVYVLFSFKDINRLKVKDWKKTFYASNNKNKARVVGLISDKISLNKIDYICIKLAD